jgi:hypothetical protein
MMMAADRPYGEFYNLNSVSPEYFGHALVSVKLIPGKTYRGVELKLHSFIHLRHKFELCVLSCLDRLSF